MRIVGLDLGKRKITYCEVLEDGSVKRQTVAELAQLQQWLGPDSPPAQVAFEACREAWWTHDVLTQWGNEPLIVDTTRVGQIGIGQHGRKNDEIDAEVLARALAERRLPLAHVLSPHRRRLREALSVRHRLVQTRAQLTAMVRETLRALGVALPSCATEDFVVMLEAQPLSHDDREQVKPLVHVLCTVQEQIAVAQERLVTRSRDEPVIERLATVRGVSLIIAAAFVSVVDDAHRFRSASHVVSYLGLCPSERSTGGRRKLGSITKQGNAYLRAMLVQGAWAVLRGPDDDPLSVWGRQVAERRGNKVAVVAVARRLVRILFAVWKHDTVYDPARLAARSADGKQQEAHDKERAAKALRRAAKTIDDTVRTARKKANAVRRPGSAAARKKTNAPA